MRNTTCRMLIIRFILNFLRNSTIPIYHHTKETRTNEITNDYPSLPFGEINIRISVRHNQNSVVISIGMDDEVNIIFPYLDVTLLLMVRD